MCWGGRREGRCERCIWIGIGPKYGVSIPSDSHEGDNTWSKDLVLYIYTTSYANILLLQMNFWISRLCKHIIAKDFFWISRGIWTANGVRGFWTANGVGVLEFESANGVRGLYVGGVGERGDGWGSIWIGIASKDELSIPSDNTWPTSTMVFLSHPTQKVIVQVQVF